MKLIDSSHNIKKEHANIQVILTFNWKMYDKDTPSDCLYDP